MKTEQKIILTFSGIVLPLMSNAAETIETGNRYFSNPLFNALLFVIVLLAILVLVLSKALRNLISSDLFIEKLKKDKQAKANNGGKTLLMFCVLSLMALDALASTATVENNSRISGLDYGTFYLMISVIALELLCIGLLLRTFKLALGEPDAKLKPLAEAKIKTKTILDKLNDTVDIEEEDQIMLDHDYDGIRELDNNMPPWWKYGFYLTILVAVIYLINYHVTFTSPLQAEEYRLSIKKAEKEVAEYMKNSANNVDETNVKVLTDAADLAAGKDLFMATCAACHGRNGEGTVGPNLTDEYWLHSGGIKDIFKTIKYGWPDKGMKSWKDDYSPMQIAQLSSFIRSLNGTKPANAKAQEGERYIETELPQNDSLQVSKDSLKTLSAGLNQ